MALEEDCNCGTVVNNTGEPTCIKHFEITSMLFLVPLYDNEGNRNFINMSTPIDIFELTQHLDPSKRWYPLTGLLDVKLPTPDPIYKTYANGQRKFLRNGIKTFEALKPESNSMLAAKLAGISCQEFGIVRGDIKGNILGEKFGSLFRPIRIGAWSAIFMDKVDDDVATTKISFDFSHLLSIRKYWILSKDDLQGVDVNEITGVVDANLEVTAISTTSIDVQTSTDYGSGLTVTGIKGLTETTDWKVVKANGSVVTVTNRVEGANGLYTLTVTGVITSDVLKISVLPASGYEGSVTAPVS